MKPTKRYTIRVLEDGEWNYWGSCDSLADALEAMNAQNEWNPVAGREWQVLMRQIVGGDMRHLGNHTD